MSHNQHHARAVASGLGGDGGCIALAVSRAHATKRSTAGLTVWFLSVTINTGRCCIGKSSDNSFREYSPGLNRRIEAGNTAIN